MTKKISLAGTLLVVVGACAGHVPVLAPSLVEEPFPESGPAPYVLQVGDLIGVRFWGYPELDEEVQIRPDGKISLPFIDEVQAADRTPAELDRALTHRYRDELASPQITVIVRQSAANHIYVGGMVNGAGLKSMKPKLTLFQALQEAGGPSSKARLKKVMLIRTFSDGSRLARTFDLRTLMSGENPNADILLQPFDVVYLPARKIEGFQTFIQEYLDPIYRLLPVRVVGTIRLFDGNQGFP